MSTPQIPNLRLELQQLTPDVRQVEVLSIPVEWTRYCQDCDGEHVFTARWRCERGFIATCGGCGEPKIVPPTRSETAAWEAYT